MHSRIVVSGLTVLALSLTACGGDSAGPKSRLTSAESAELIMQLSSTVQASASGSAGASMNRMADGASFASAPSPLTLSLDTSVPCPVDGQTHLTLSVNGTVDPTAHTATLDVTGTNAPENCGYHLKDVVVHVTGDPSLTHTAHLSIVNGVPVGAQTFTATGGFTWSSSDGRSGSCSLDYTATADYTANTVTATGTVCGTKVEFSGPLTPGTA